jgi:hypothetical protein
VKRAAGDGFRQPAAVLIYTTAAFLAGIGFFRDPVFTVPAARQLAALASAADHGERTALLRDAVRAFLDKGLATADADLAAA